MKSRLTGRMSIWLNVRSRPADVALIFTSKMLGYIFWRRAWMTLLRSRFTSLMWCTKPGAHSTLADTTHKLPMVKSWPGLLLVLVMLFPSQLIPACISTKQTLLCQRRLKMDSIRMRRSREWPNSCRSPYDRKHLLELFWVLDWKWGSSLREHPVGHGCTNIIYGSNSDQCKGSLHVKVKASRFETWHRGDELASEQ